MAGRRAAVGSEFTTGDVDEAIRRAVCTSGRAVRGPFYV
jgi:hypothetical protein